MPKKNNQCLIPQSRSVHSGNILTVKKVNFDQEIFQQFDLDCAGKKIKGYRLLQPVQNRKIGLSLTDKQGKRIAQSDSTELQIPKIAPGEYLLNMEVFDGGMKVLQEQCKITVLASPWD